MKRAGLRNRAVLALAVAVLGVGAVVAVVLVGGGLHRMSALSEGTPSGPATASGVAAQGTASPSLAVHEGVALEQSVDATPGPTATLAPLQITVREGISVGSGNGR